MIEFRKGEPQLIPQPDFVELRAGDDGKLYGRTADNKWFVYSEPIQNVERVCLGEGDKLVVTCRHPISREVRENIEKITKDFFGHHVPVLVVPSDLKVTVIHEEQEVAHVNSNT